MTTLEKIQSKVKRIDIEELIKRLKIELKIENKGIVDIKSEEGTTFLEYSMYDTLLLILDVTHLKKIDDSLYSIWVAMIKDYWFLNNYDKLISTSDEEDEDDNLEVSSIKTGDTEVKFSSKSKTINVNGTAYSTGTINFDQNILVEKYKSDLYRHRKLRW